MKSHLLRTSLLAAFLILCAPLFFQTQAQAKIPLFIINTGDIIYPVADIPDELAETETDLSGYKLGYKCSHFGVLFADVWCWDKQLVLFKDTSIRNQEYMDLPDEIRPSLEKKYPFSKTDRSPWNKYGIFVIIGGMVFFGMMKK